MIVKAIEYVPPNGKRVEMEIEVPDRFEETYEQIRTAGANLAGELLSNGMVSLTIEDRLVEDDFDCELVANGPEVPKAMERLLERFKLADFIVWRGMRL